MRRHKVLSGLLVLLMSVLGIWGVRLVRLRQEVGRYRRYWSQPQGQAGGLVYVALGDSTAQGIGAGAPERGYVGLIAQRLRTTTGRPVQVVNLSRTGARVRDVVADQLPKLTGLTPDLVTVAIGANDIRSYDARRFRTDVDELVAMLPPNTVVGDVPWFMHGGAGRSSDQAATYEARAAGSLGLTVARLHDATRRQGWAGMLTDFAADWFHPSDRGYRIWAGAFWEAIIVDPRLASLGIPAA